MATVVITIGLNSNRTLRPLPDGDARNFVRDVRGTVELFASSVFVDAASGWGSWVDQATGRPVREHNRTWIADVEPDRIADLADELSFLARTYEQDAIAMTSGATSLVNG